MQNVINWIINLSYWQAALLLFAAWVVVIFIPGIAKVEFQEAETSSYAKVCNSVISLAIEIALCYIARNFFYYLAYLMIILQAGKLISFTWKFVMSIRCCLGYSPSFFGPPFKNIFVFLLQSIVSLAALAVLVVFCYHQLYQFIWPFA